MTKEEFILKRDNIRKDINNDIVIFDQYICNGFNTSLELGREKKK